MRWPLLFLLSFCWLGTPLAAAGATGRVIKVLPEYLDAKGRSSLAPSLYERDAYQAILRENPSKRAGLRFYIQWKTKGPVWEPLKVRIQVRGPAQGNLPRELVLEKPVENKGGWFSHWAEVTLTAKEYHDFGGLAAWRVTLWEGRTLLGQQQSFMW
jgi:hypothetical protein